MVVNLITWANVFQQIGRPYTSPKKWLLTPIFINTGTGAGVNAYIIDTGIYPDNMYFGGRASVHFDAMGDGGDVSNGNVNLSMYERFFIYLFFLNLKEYI